MTTITGYFKNKTKETFFKYTNKTRSFYSFNYDNNEKKYLLQLVTINNA